MNAETSATSPPHRKRRFPTHQTTVYSPTRDRQNSKRYNTPKGPLQHHPAVLALGVGEEDKEARSASRGGASPVRTVTTPPAVVALGGGAPAPRGGQTLEAVLDPPCPFGGNGGGKPAVGASVRNRRDCHLSGQREGPREGSAGATERFGTDGGGESRGQGLPVAARYSLRLGASPGWPRRSKGQQAATYRSGRQGS